MNKLAPLFALAVLVTASSVALSGEPEAPRTDEQIVHAAVIKPLIERHRQRAMFSRAVLRPPTFKSWLDKVLHVDTAGAKFRAFRVLRDDQPHLEGCVYPADGAVYVRTVGVDKPTYLPASRHPNLKDGGLRFPGLNDDKPQVKQAAAPARKGACREATPNT